MTTDLPKANLQSPYLGIGLIVCALGLATLLAKEGPLSFRFGVASGALAASAVLTLPLFLLWRYATVLGRRQKLSARFNVFVGAMLVIWVAVFVIAKNMLPTLVARTNSASQVAASNQTSTDTSSSSNPLPSPESIKSPSTDISAALSTVLIGEFFGYHVGQGLPASEPIVSEESGDSGVINILARNQHLPTGISQLQLIVSPKTRTVGNIYAVGEFSTEKDAKTIARLYAATLNAIYAKQCASADSYPDPRRKLLLLCAGKYELSVVYYPPRVSRPGWVVHVGLRPSPDSIYGKMLRDQFLRELR
jgi:hypothetical protein